MGKQTGNYSRLTAHERRAMFFILFLGIVLAIFGSILVQELLAADTLINVRIANAIPLILSLSAFISAGLFLSGKPILGTWTIFIVIIVGLVIAPILAEGYGYPAAAIVLVTTIYLPSLIFRGRQASLSFILGAVAAATIILIDTFASNFFARIEVENSDVQIANYLTVLLLVIFLIGLSIQFQRFNLRAKLITGFLVITVLSIFLVSAQSMAINTKYLTESIGKNLYATAKDQSLAVGKELASQVKLLTALAYNNDLQNQLREQNLSYLEIEESGNTWGTKLSDIMTNKISLELRGYLYRIPDLANVFITDRFGNLVGSTTRRDNLVLSGNEWWQYVYNNGSGNIFIGTPILDPNTYSVKVQIILPVFDKVTNQFIGEIGTTYLSDTLTSFAHINENDHELTSEIDLIIPGPSPYILTNMHSEEQPEPDEVRNALVQSAENEYFSQFYAGSELMMSLVKIEGLSENSYISELNWVVAVHEKLEIALAPIGIQRRATTMILLVVAAIATGGAILFSQFLSGPIRRLSQSAANFGAGQLDSHALVETEDEIGTLAATFNAMVDQINNTLQNLENEIHVRTQAVIVSSEISSKLSTILNQDQLVISVVEEIQSRYGYYHVQIYLMSRNQQYLIMVGGTGEPGKAMVASGHQVPIGQGLVGRAARENKSIIVSNTHEDPSWLPNPILPDTRSEIAVPLSIGGRVMGVLDIQASQIDSFNPETAELIQSIANQVAIGILNARSFDEAQERAELDAKTLMINQKIQSAVTIQNALEITAKELGQALNLKHAVVELDLEQHKRILDSQQN